MTMVDRMVSELTGIPLADDDTRRLGIIARVDEGGLGAQTLEYVRHLRPDRVLVPSVDPPRGVARMSRLFDAMPHESDIDVVSFPEAGMEDADTWWRFVDNVDVVLTAETTYNPQLGEMLAAQGKRVVVHANPELWEWHRGAPAGVEAWAPSEWLMHKLPPGTPHVPVPVDRDRCRHRHVEEVRTLLHVSAPAMRDRNGTQSLKEALLYCRTSFTLLVSGPEAPTTPTNVGTVTVRGIGRVDDYWRIYDDADALVLPRRYGGLCLPMQEAASCGLPIIAPGVSPQGPWLAPSLALSTGPLERTRARMKGGLVDVWRYPPTQIAQRVDALVSGDGLEDGRKASEAWAAFLDWREWEPVYAAKLRGGSHG